MWKWCSDSLAGGVCSSQVVVPMNNPQARNARAALYLLFPARVDLGWLFPWIVGSHTLLSSLHTEAKPTHP